MLSRARFGALVRLIVAQRFYDGRIYFGGAGTRRASH